ncbi:MAG: lysophospholipid acyltransferase family protein [Chloroflexota bacterium]
MLRTILRAFFRILFKVTTRLEVTGLERIPMQGGVILAVNHLGIIDAPVVFILLERQDVTGLVADTYQKKPFFRFLVGAVDGIWINRGTADMQALKQALQYLQAGGMLGIAPEGTRSRTGMLIQAKTGVAYLADKAGVPVVPIAIYGSEKYFRQLPRLKRTHIRISVGQALNLPSVERKDREAGLIRNTDEIMCRIAAMMPPEYWGVYAGYPRLAELVAEQGPPK